VPDGARLGARPDGGDPADDRQRDVQSTRGIRPFGSRRTDGLVTFYWPYFGDRAWQGQPDKDLRVVLGDKVL